MTRTQLRKKRNRKKIVKAIIRNIVCLIVGAIAIVYYLLKAINNLVIKLFNKLPRLLKVSVIYSMIVLSAIGIVNFNTTKVETIVEEKIIEKVVAMEKVEEQPIVETEKEFVFNNENETNIYNTAIEKGFTKDQAILAISISRHETGNWTSKAFNDKNNFGGIMCNHATEIKRYSTYQEGLEDFLRVLKTYYFEMGLNTIEEIGAKYCPIGATNDPNNLNQYWVGGVTNFYNSYQESVK